MTKNEELSINFIQHLSQSKTPLPLGDISKSLGCSEGFLYQIASKLKKAGIIESKRGPFGGYYIVEIPRFFDIKKCFRKKDQSLAGRAKYLDKLTDQFYKSVPVAEEESIGLEII